jgi:hypothetical protein
MHVRMCVIMNKAYARCDCCEAMEGCFGVCVWPCTRHMLTVFAVRQCMRNHAHVHRHT